MEVKKLIRLSMLVSLSVILSIIESFIPIFNTIPGLKLGLANTVIILVLYVYGFKDALLVSIIRIFIVGILRVGLFNLSFFFSLGGAFLSVLMMFLFKRLTKLSPVGISLIGSISHNIGQVLIALILIYTDAWFIYLPYLIIFSIPTGIIIGFISKEMIKEYKKIIDNQKEGY